MKSFDSLITYIKFTSYKILAKYKQILIVILIIPFFGTTCPQVADLSEPFDGGNLQSDPEVSKKYANTSLEIVQSSPQGMVSVNDLSREIVVVFNQPMVPLAKLKNITSGVLKVTPGIKGRYRWYGSRVNSFIPSEKMKPGTRYTVTIPASTRSLSKQTLKKDYTFSFKSPALKFSYSSPYKNSTIQYNQEFMVHFNYPVKISEIKKYINLQSNGISRGFNISRPKNNNNSRSVLIKPDSNFPRDARISLTLNKGLPPDGGNAGLEKEITLLFKTYGPLKAELTNRADFFQDSYGIYLHFNNPVDLKKLAKSIKTTPKLKLVRTPDGNSNYLYLSSFALQPEQSYTLELPPGLQGIYGNKITGNRSFQIDVPRMRKSFSMTSGVNTVEALKKQFIPARASAIDEVSGQVYPFGIEQLQKFIAIKSKDHYDSLRQSSPKKMTFRTGLSSKMSGPIGLNVKPALENSRGWILADIKANAENYKGEDRENNSSVVLQSTDIGLIIKQSPGYSHAYIHSLTPGKSMESVLVTGYDGTKKIGSCRTNNIGYCRILHFGIKRPIHPIYTAATNKDKAFVTGLHHAVYMGSQNVEFDLLSHESSLSGVIEFDRKLYRPGETMHFKGFLALIEKEKLKTKITQNARVVIYDSRGKQLAVMNKKISPEGGIDGSLDLNEQSKTGHYRIEVSLPSQKKKFNDAKSSLAGRQYGYNNIRSHNRFKISETFQVEQFRPVQFSVSIDTKAVAKREDKTHKFKINGQYLFGAPMIKAPVKYTIQKKKSRRSPSNFSDFRFGDFDYRDQENGWSFYSSGSGDLDSSGHYENKISFEKTGIPARSMGLDFDRTLSTIEEFQIESRVTDVDKKTVTHNKIVRMDPATAIPGIQTKNLYNSTRTPFEFRLVAVAADGKFAGNLPFKTAIIFNEWKSIQTKGPGGTVQRKNTLVRKIVHSSSLSLNNKPVLFRYKAKKPGWYSIIVYGSGSDVYSRSSFYVYGGGFTGWNFSDDDTLDLLADKPVYNPGDKARILIQSPFKAARAIVSLERNGIMWQKSFILKGNSYPVTIPISKEHSPVVYASVMLIRPRVDGTKLDKKASSTDDDMGRPKFKMGYVALKVKSTQGKLPLKILSNQKSYSPGDYVDLTVKTAAYAEVALSVADRGVLDLIAYSYKNPTKRFQKELPLGVVVMENRQSLIRQLSYARKGDSPGGKGTEESEGGRGGFDQDSEDGIRKNFKYTAHWKPSLKADQNGEISLRFKLPDNLTTFKIMAMAARKGSYAAANHEIQVRQPLIIQPITPTIIRPGDELRIGAVIINQTGIDITVNLDINSRLLKIKGNKNNEIKIPNGRSVESLFNVSLDSLQYQIQKQAIIDKLKKTKKLPIGGISGVQVHAILSATTNNASTLSKKTGIRKSDLNDKIAIKFDVFENPPAEAFSITGSVDQVAQKEAVVLPKRSEILNDLGNLDIQISNTALTGIKNGFVFFKDNPYFCLEQRASAFIVGVSAGELIHSFPQKSLQKDAYQFKELNKIFLEKLPAYQNSDGGFRLWKNSRYKISNPYLTAWAIFGMQVAQKNGYKINNTIKNSALGYLSQFRRKPGRHGHNYLLSTYSLVAWVLARDGKSDRGLIRYLLKNEKKLRLRDRAYLALTLQLDRNIKNFNNDPDTKRLMQSILDSMQFTTRSISFKENRDLFGGRSFQANGATLALILRTMVLLNPKHPMIPQMIRHIVDSRNRSVWSNSHSSANLAYSLKAYYDKFEKTPDSRVIEVTLGSKTLMQTTLPAPSKTVAGFHKRLSLQELYKSFNEAKQYDFVFSNKNANKGRFYYTATLDYLPRLLKTKARDEGIEVIREVIGLSDLNSDNKIDVKSLNTLSGDAMKLGKMYLIRLMVTNPKPSFNFVLMDPLPSSIEAVNSEFATESPVFSRFLSKKKNTNRSWWMREEIQYDYRKDKVISTAEYLSPGVHEFMYLARPIVKGKSNAPAAQAFLMYSPEVFGRTAAGMINVKP